MQSPQAKCSPAVSANAVAHKCCKMQLPAEEGQAVLPQCSHARRAVWAGASHYSTLKYHCTRERRRHELRAAVTPPLLVPAVYRIVSGCNLRWYVFTFRRTVPWRRWFRGGGRTDRWTDGYLCRFLVHLFFIHSWSYCTGHTEKAKNAMFSRSYCAEHTEKAKKAAHCDTKTFHSFIRRLYSVGQRPRRRAPHRWISYHSMDFPPASSFGAQRARIAGLCASAAQRSAVMPRHNGQIALRSPWI